MVRPSRSGVDPQVFPKNHFVVLEHRSGMGACPPSSPLTGMGICRLQHLEQGPRPHCRERQLEDNKEVPRCHRSMCAVCAPSEVPQGSESPVRPGVAPRRVAPDRSSVCRGKQGVRGQECSYKEMADLRSSLVHASTGSLHTSRGARQQAWRPRWKTLLRTGRRPTNCGSMGYNAISVPASWARNHKRLESPCSSGRREGQKQLCHIAWQSETSCPHGTSARSIFGEGGCRLGTFWWAMYSKCGWKHPWKTLFRSRAPRGILPGRKSTAQPG